MPISPTSSGIKTVRVALFIFLAGMLIDGQKSIGPEDTGTGTMSLTAATTVTENFNTLSNTAGSTTNTTLPTGWYMTEGGLGARDNEQYAVDTGGSTTGDTYSYGAAASTERAFGELRSGTLIPNFGAKFTNNTGRTITALAVSFTGEEWRLGTTGRTDQLNFEYSTDATDLSTGTYVGVAALNFATPDTGVVGAMDGNSAAERTVLSTTITGLSIPNGATFFFRWTDTDATGADDGLAIDDFSIRAVTMTAAGVSVSGRVLRPDGIPVRYAAVTMTDAHGTTRTVTTGRGGIFTFADVEAGGTYTLSVSQGRFAYAPRVVSVTDNVGNVDFTPEQ